MSAHFAFLSAFAVAALMLFTVWRLGSRRDFFHSLGGFTLIFAVSAGLGISGVLQDFSKIPPPFLFFLIGLLLTSAAIVLSPWGGRVAAVVPLRVLIALQGFRILPETLLDLAFREGLAPVQMTWHGRNLDILSAVFGLLLALAWNKLANPKPWAWIYNLAAFALLVNIVSIAILSSPTPFRVFMNEPANTFVMRFPYIWLPAVHVLVALVLHGLALRSLRRSL